LLLDVNLNKLINSKRKGSRYLLISVYTIVNFLPELFKIWWILFLACLNMLNNNCSAKLQYLFHNLNVNIIKRSENVLSVLTVDEKISCFRTNSTIDRFGIKRAGHTEGLHGLALGVHAGWNKKFQ